MSNLLDDAEMLRNHLLGSGPRLNMLREWQGIGLVPDALCIDHALEPYSFDRLRIVTEVTRGGVSHKREHECRVLFHPKTLSNFFGGHPSRWNNLALTKEHLFIDPVGVARGWRARNLASYCTYLHTDMKTHFGARGILKTPTRFGGQVRLIDSDLLVYILATVPLDEISEHINETLVVKAQESITRKALVAIAPKEVVVKVLDTDIEDLLMSMATPVAKPVVAPMRSRSLTPAEAALAEIQVKRQALLDEETALLAEIKKEAERATRMENLRSAIRSNVMGATITACDIGPNLSQFKRPEDAIRSVQITLPGGEVVLFTR